MRNTYLSRSALKAALLPFFPAGRAGTALLPLRLSVVAAFLFHGSGKAGELSTHSLKYGNVFFLSSPWFPATVSSREDGDLVSKMKSCATSLNSAA